MAWRIDRYHDRESMRGGTIRDRKPVKNDYTGRVKLFDMKPIATSYAKLSCFDAYIVEHHKDG